MGCIYGIPTIHGNNELFFLTTQVKEDVGQDKDRDPGFKRTYR